MRSLILLCALLFIVFAGFTGCASNATREALTDERLNDLPRQSTLDVPFYAQSNELCGPTALKMVLAEEGFDSPLDTLITYTYSPNLKGSTKSDMLGAVRRLGLVPIKIKSLDKLLESVTLGHPVVVFYNSGLSFHTVWHFGVLTGYDLEAKKVYVHAGEVPNQRMNLDFFYERWLEGDLWAMAISSPSSLFGEVNLDEMIENLNVLVNLDAIIPARELLKQLEERFPGRIELGPYREALL